MRPRVEAIPEEHRVAPKPSIAAPAMQGLAFSLDEPELKKLYLDLLASASDDRHNKSVHPAFVEVIRQLSAEEIPILAYPLGSHMVLAMARVVGKTADGAQISLLSHLTEHIDSCPGLDVASELLPTYVDNWVRLGLVEVVYGERLARAGAYAWLDRRTEVQHLRDTSKDGAIVSVETETGVLRPTAFGYAFANAVGMEESAVFLTYLNNQVLAAQSSE